MAAAFTATISPSTHILYTTPCCKTAAHRRANSLAVCVACEGLYELETWEKILLGL
jgi:hypothetical protein